MRHFRDLSFHDLAIFNRIRQSEWPGQAAAKVDAAYRGLELGGEAGELQNVIKKLERERHGMAGSRATEEQLMKEVGDVVICASLIANHYGVELGECVALAFNKTSEQVGLSTTIRLDNDFEPL